MGNLHPQPTVYLKARWIDDSEADSCCNCFQCFTVLRRRHHCRCCGELFCSECWGMAIKLPPEYSFSRPQPVCNVCHSLFCGDLKMLRLPRRVAVFRSPKTVHNWTPPLTQSPENIGLFYVRISQWRPFGGASTFEFYRSISDINDKFLQDSQTVSSDYTPRSASAMTPRWSSRYSSRLSNLQLSGASTGRQIFSTGSLGSDEANSISYGHPWSLPLGGIASIVLDHDSTSNWDFVTIETTHERIGVQAVKPKSASQVSKNGSSTPFSRHASTDVADYVSDEATTSLLSSEMARVLSIAHARLSNSQRRSSSP